jgi:hypothetical protein
MPMWGVDEVRISLNKNTGAWPQEKNSFFVDFSGGME